MYEFSGYLTPKIRIEIICLLDSDNGLFSSTQNKRPSVVGPMYLWVVFGAAPHMLQDSVIQHAGHPDSCKHEFVTKRAEQRVVVVVVVEAMNTSLQEAQETNNGLLVAI